MTSHAGQLLLMFNAGVIRYKLNESYASCVHGAYSIESRVYWSLLHVSTVCCSDHTVDTCSSLMPGHPS